jgi:hypothetical protein
VVGIYCAESLYLRWRGKPLAQERMLWLTAISAVLLSAINPNGFRILRVMRNYRNSPMQTQIWEWQYPKFWELTPFSLLLFGALLVALLNRRKLRPADWLLLAAFGVSGLLALRNTILTALAGSVLIFVYLPEWKSKLGMREWIQVGALSLGALLTATGYPLLAAAAIGATLVVWSGRFRIPAEFGIAVLLLATTGALFLGGNAFQFRASEGPPSDAADFLIQHHIHGRLYNSYIQGGYLIWRLWPQLQVFIDGRALNEKVYQDSQRIGMNAAEGNGKSGEALLQEYGIDIIVMDGFEPVSGSAHYLPAALADPRQTDWKLVYRDVHDVIYMRHPPPDVPVLNTFDALAGMEEQCQYLVDHDNPACAQGMIDVFTRVGDGARLRKWTNIYRDHPMKPVFSRF